MNMGTRFWVNLNYYNIEDSTCTWDPRLWMSFKYYFCIAINTHTWDPSSLAYFDIAMKTHPWGPILWFYILRTSDEKNIVLRGVEHSDPP
jgi:hypothetical protein